MATKRGSQENEYGSMSRQGSMKDHQAVNAAMAKAMNQQLHNVRALEQIKTKVTVRPRSRGR